MKRAFGFSPEEEEEDGDYDSALPTYAVDGTPTGKAPERTDDNTPTPPERKQSKSTTGNTKNSQQNNTRKEQQSGSHKEPSHETATAPAEPVTAEISDEALPADLFDAVIKLFNEQQPEFVKTCLSTEAQRKYIVDSIADSLKARIKTTIHPISPQQAWNEERKNLTSRIEQLESGSADTESLRKENRRLQLSVDRQKRALLDRINDLETQVVRLNEEKERIYTKKKLPVDTALLDKANSRIDELEKELKKLSDTDESVCTGNVELEENCRKFEAECQKQAEVLKSLEAKCEELETERRRLEEEVKAKEAMAQQLQTKIQVSDVLINDLRNENAAARNELKKTHEEQEIAITQIQQQLDSFEKLKARKDAKIAENTKRINELTKENESLRHTIENNLYNHATSEHSLNEEIRALRSRLETTKAAITQAQQDETGDTPSGNTDTTLDIPGSEPRQQRRRGRPKKVRIDSSLDNTDWFASGKKDDPDFGYHEPPRRPVNDNEAQLTLF
ncbi:MAG: hypothetical protein K2J65_08675 [Duncaniella sp.]|nr:hypothetical protein [Duncaniella sp.]